MISKKYLIVSTVIISVLFLSFLFYIKGGYSQSPPPLPPIPPHLIPSVLEDIRNTKHNLSSIGPAGRSVYTEQTTEICVFCHTPHGADPDAAGITAPIWNRNLSRAHYILYDQVWSTSFEGYEVNPPRPNAPTGYSRLCLSCHDGTIALGTIVNFPGSGTSYTPLGMLYPTGQSPAGGSGTMPVGSGVSTGDTRVIGTNLQNDHPVSFVFDTNLALQDEELVDPGPPLISPAQKMSNPTPISPLRRYPHTDLSVFNAVQCTSCHNPHATTYPKFLRASAFNDPGNKIICLYCHDKPGWVNSSHDTDTFTPPPTPQANPYNYDGSHTVGQYACRACHDPHTAQGAKRLLREGVDANNNFAIENTCFLCHKPAAELAGGQGTFPPDIRSEFQKDTNSTGNGSAMNLTLSERHEPVFVARPQEGVELFSLAPPLFNEYPPGMTLRDTAHIECVDCHNPHQVTKTNRLKGMKGIDINGNVAGAKIPGNSREPYVYEVCLRCHGNSYTNLFNGDRFPDDSNEVRGGGSNTYSITYRSNPRGGTPVNGAAYSMKGFSNKRKELDPNTPDLDLPGDGVPSHTKQSQNPAYHPVAVPGRNGTTALCAQLAVAFNLKSSFSNPGGGVGDCDANPSGTLKNITIQCTDCHNSNAFENVIRGPITGLPDGTSYRRITDSPAAPSPSYNSLMQSYSDNPATPQGPHGSGYIRILRGRYNTDIMNPARCFRGENPSQCRSGDGASPSFADNFNLCFQCHDRRAFDYYTNSNTREERWTNFIGRPGSNTGSWNGNLHQFHLLMSGSYCHECHNNVHSNIEAQNTKYGDGMGGSLPPDSKDGISDGISGSHLINFGPTVTGSVDYKPRWSFEGDRVRCYLSCHNITMDSCYYQNTGSGSQCAVGGCVIQ